MVGDPLDRLGAKGHKRGVMAAVGGREVLTQFIIQRANAPSLCVHDRISRLLATE
jgi:hypothetical protein